jgi:hypothetical protein
MSESIDPLDDVFCQSGIVPDLKWMVEELPKIDILGESLVMLREMVGDEVYGSKYDVTVNMQLLEILLLTGAERNPLRDRLANIEDNTHLKYVVKMKMQKINAVIKRTLQIMRASEMKQWQIADDDDPFIVLTETKFSFRCIPVWIGTLLTGLGSKKKTHVIMFSP